MNARYIAIALGIGCMLALGIWYFWPAETVRNYPSAGTDIIAFGDSLVQGVGATEGHDLVSLLSNRIGVPIINLGHSGDTTEDGLARISELDAYDPKIVILLLGGNDYLRRVPPEQTFANLSKIIENIQARGAIVLLLGIRGGILNDHFDSSFEHLHDTYHTAYASNVLAGLLGKKEYMSDQIHPNDIGYQKIADRIAPDLKRLLK